MTILELELLNIVATATHINGKENVIVGEFVSWKGFIFFTYIFGLGAAGFPGPAAGLGGGGIFFLAGAGASRGTIFFLPISAGYKLDGLK
jgi:hypothetical protein